ncbi:hypothetical protein [Anabaena azotica]|uniref:Uncharacterized protein n=1 Tax=Anabaena azotica FACHB-119 TaxID=947527 RepID=A0ABR8CXX7_9NOST|nr:hypothetical protein [Anabaena azotica]MBD2499682.1 hypothetical protein [Anabaena azotica FACHB-119]
MPQIAFAVALCLYWPGLYYRRLKNPSPNLSPTRREALISPSSLPSARRANVGKGAGGLGLALAFPHDLKSQN